MGRRSHAYDYYEQAWQRITPPPEAPIDTDTPVDAGDDSECDVFWNNEVAQTIRLAELGLLEPYDSPSAADIPELFRDPERRWTGFAARARVLIVNSDLVPAGEEPRGTMDLFDPRWAGRCGIARPLTGTTLTHATGLYEVMGEGWARDFFTRVVEANQAGTVNLPESNGQAMTLEKNGALAWAWTRLSSEIASLASSTAPGRRWRG